MTSRFLATGMTSRYTAHRLSMGESTVTF